MVVFISKGKFPWVEFWMQHWAVIQKWVGDAMAILFCHISWFDFRKANRSYNIFALDDGPDCMCIQCVLLTLAFSKNGAFWLPKSLYEQCISIFKSRRPVPFEFLLFPDSKWASFKTGGFKSKSHRTINFTGYTWKNCKSVLTGPIPNPHWLWHPAKCHQNI